MRERETRSRRFAKTLRRRMTDAETILWSQLRRGQLGGWKFRRQHAVGPYITDFACLEARIILEVDGATHAENHEIEHDRTRSAFLTEQGFSVLRVSNLDVYRNLDGVVRLICAALPPSGPQGHLPRERGRKTNSDTPVPVSACGASVSIAGERDEPDTSSTQGESSYD